MTTTQPHPSPLPDGAVAATEWDRDHTRIVSFGCWGLSGAKVNFPSDLDGEPYVYACAIQYADGALCRDDSITNRPGIHLENPTAVNLTADDANRLGRLLSKAAERIDFFVHGIPCGPPGSHPDGKPMFRITPDWSGLDIRDHQGRPLKYHGTEPE